MLGMKRSVIACLLLLASCQQPAYAHSWYDAYCCNDKDCRPLSDFWAGVSEVRLTNKGYIWTSKTSGAVHFIPHGDERLKPSRDGEFHGCEITRPLGYEYARCLCVPMLF